MTMIIDGTNGLTFNNSTVQASAGVVLQVVNATNNLGTSVSTSTYVDTGLTATITPKFSTSKILVVASMNDCERQNGTAVYGKFQLVRNSTGILEFAKEAGYSSTAGGSLAFSVSTSYLDSPATTSATTYKVQFASTTNNAAIQVNASGAYSTITLMEIAG